MPTTLAIFMPSAKTTTPARPAPLACLGCRRAHLKCDGITPTCSRCASHGSICNYTVSRRGRRPGAKQLRNRTEATNSPPVSYSIPPSSRWIPDRASDLDGQTASVDSVDQAIDNTRSQLPSVPVPPCSLSSQLVEPVPQWIDDEQLVHLFYLNFHINHPILLPKDLYWKRVYPCFLKAVVEYIGSHFLATLPNRALREDIAKELELGEKDSPEIVQARILYATILFAQNESHGCQQVLARAVESAIKLGMYRREFAASHTNYQPAEEESIRLSIHTRMVWLIHI
ncbi:hypothetical protein GQ44DRAFT_727471 [Phaeosphaeriaceae sp. PMI808]|nr:hypothetical protein GQ44DRAFT_727471 [Phaeosphaeriaceae sp. PMI808]